MNEGTIRSLEFDRIVEAVRSFAQTPLGATELAKLRPSSDPRSVRTALAATSECVRYLESNPPFALNAPTDLKRSLTALAVEGHALEPTQLIGVADFLSSVGVVRRVVAQAAGGPYPALRTILDGCRPFDREVATIHTALDRADGVADGASSKLGSIRARLSKQRSRLRSTLDSYLRGKDTAKYLQEQVVTERNGRYVLVVRVEHRHAIPGIVHGSSGSGASLFLEPLSTVEINNDIVALEDDEHKEVHRILLALANLLRARALDLRTTLAAATDVDVVQARATFSRLIEGIEPTVSTDSGLDFLQARHPLLIPAVRRRLGGSPEAPDAPAPVPNDVRVSPENPALIVTGPNTGGKTVALKTVGLLALMAQAGLLVPAGAGSKTTILRTVFADIGDEQSITASLSTFSAHIANIVSMERRLRLPALVLLDEIGAGTDPVEGGALGAAVVDHFKQRGAFVIVTTHNDALKSYAATTPGVTCAGLGFDADSFAPTYRLTYGTPGRSLALEIAGRLGMTPQIIDAARRRRSEREAQLADHLANVDSDLRRLDKERHALAEERRQLASEQNRLAAERQALEGRQTALRQQFVHGIDEQVRTARAEIDSVVESLRQKASQLERAAATRAETGRRVLSTGETGALKATARAAVDHVAFQARARAGPSAVLSDAVSTTAPADGPQSVPPRVGAQVTVGALGIEGRVLAVHDEQAEVDVRGKRLRISVHNLRIVHDGTRPPPTPTGKVTVRVDSSDGPLSDLNVIGCTVDEARSRVEKYLDRALLQEQRHVRIVHGHGTGQLRRSIGRLLQDHPEVDRFEPAPPNKGGGGVTVVELKE